MKVALKDGCPRNKGVAEVNVRRNGNLLEIAVDGYGEYGAEPGQGCQVLIEHYDGEVVVRVFADINQAEPTFRTSLENAKEVHKTAAEQTPVLAEDESEQFDI